MQSRVSANFADGALGYFAMAKQLKPPAVSEGRAGGAPAPGFMSRAHAWALLAFALGWASRHFAPVAPIAHPPAAPAAPADTARRRADEEAQEEDPWERSTHPGMARDGFNWTQLSMSRAGNFPPTGHKQYTTEQLVEKGAMWLWHTTYARSIPATIAGLANEWAGKYDHWTLDDYRREWGDIPVVCAFSPDVYFQRGLVKDPRLGRRLQAPHRERMTFADFIDVSRTHGDIEHVAINQSPSRDFQEFGLPPLPPLLEQACTHRYRARPSAQPTRACFGSSSGRRSTRATSGRACRPRFPPCTTTGRSSPSHTADAPRATEARGTRGRTRCCCRSRARSDLRSSTPRGCTPLTRRSSSSTSWCARASSSAAARRRARRRRVAGAHGPWPVRVAADAARDRQFSARQRHAPGLRAPPAVQGRARDDDRRARANVRAAPRHSLRRATRATGARGQRAGAACVLVPPGREFRAAGRSQRCGQLLVPRVRAPARMEPRICHNPRRRRRHSLATRLYRTLRENVFINCTMPSPPGKPDACRDSFLEAR